MVNNFHPESVLSNFSFHKDPFIYCAILKLYFGAVCHVNEARRHEKGGKKQNYKGNNAEEYQKSMWCLCIRVEEDNGLHAGYQVPDYKSAARQAALFTSLLI